MKITNSFPIYTVDIYQDNYRNETLFVHTDYKRIKQLYNQEIRERMQYPNHGYILTLKKWYVYNNYEELESYNNYEQNEQNG